MLRAQSPLRLNMLARFVFLAALGLQAAPAAAADGSGAITAASVQVGEPASPSVDEPGWEFSAGPYLWMSSIKGDLGVVPEVEPVGADLSFGDILDHMKFALMGKFDARRGRFIATGDVLFLKMSASDNIEIREVDFLDVKLTSSTFLTTVTAGYRAIDKDRMFLDLLAGGRLNVMKTGLDLTGPQRSFSGSKTETWVDPVIAARFQVPLGQHWAARIYGDAGGFGVGSHFTWQLVGGVEYDVSSRWTLSAGWRHLDIDYDHQGFVFDAAMDGPVLGAVYQF
jgi:opacity protein-like surface antigen